MLQTTSPMTLENFDSKAMGYNSVSLASTRSTRAMNLA